MNSSTDERQPDFKASPLVPSGLSSFRRIQLVLGWWGVLLIVGGFLHSPVGRSFTNYGMLVMWLGLTIIGVIGSQIITSEILDSGMHFVWVGFVGGALLITLIFMLVGWQGNLTGRIWLFVSWQVVVAAGYALTAVYMDKRFWLLAAWAIAVAIFLLVLPDAATVTTPTTPTITPTPAPNDGYNYSYGMITLLQAQASGFDIKRNLGLFYGLANGIPLIIAALPFWKEN
jgi:hypothetical protein